MLNTMIPGFDFP